MKGKVNREEVLEHIDKTVNIIRKQRDSYDKKTIEVMQERLKKGYFFGLFGKVENPSIHDAIAVLERESIERYYMCDTDEAKDLWKSEFCEKLGNKCLRIEDLVKNSFEIWLTEEDWDGITLHERWSIE